MVWYLVMSLRFLVLSHPNITKEIWIFIYSDLTVYITGNSR